MDIALRRESISIFRVDLSHTVIPCSRNRNQRLYSTLTAKLPAQPDPKNNSALIQNEYITREQCSQPQLRA